MQTLRSLTLPIILKGLVAVLIVKVTFGIVLIYRDYLPPNFDSDFLQGRESYFFDSYRWAFYAHITSGPLSLILGLILLSQRFRRRFTVWHRRLGRIQAANVLLLVAPAGFWMAFYAGTLAGTAFALLAVATAGSVLLGWKSAVERRFADHQRWMERCYVLLCSAVVLRLLGGIAFLTGLNPNWTYPTAAWASWLVPLTVYELFRLQNAGPVPTGQLDAKCPGR